MCSLKFNALYFYNIEIHRREWILWSLSLRAKLAKWRFLSRRIFVQIKQPCYDHYKTLLESSNSETPINFSIGRNLHLQQRISVAHTILPTGTRFAQEQRHENLKGFEASNFKMHVFFVLPAWQHGRREEPQWCSGRVGAGFAGQELALVACREISPARSSRAHGCVVLLVPPPFRKYFIIIFSFWHCLYMFIAL